jgi:bifunctional non-homologous end joining protein LigD
MPRPPHPDPLAAYRAKRSADRTLEPFGRPGASRPRQFVVQKHAARRLHHDFRLELNGTLLSWAVPKGPSLDPKEKRLAVHVEDHPVEYADFEGTIAEGNYGAGPVIVWDKGSWLPLEDPVAGMEKGKLLFELKGYKLKGVWTLVRTHAGEGRDWLLMKKPDAYASAGETALPEGSVFSGLKVEELDQVAERRASLLARMKEAGAVERRLDAKVLRPMLATTQARAFNREGWWFEVKYDGYRLLAAREQGQPALFYRSGLVATGIFPELAVAVGAFPHDVVLDGEVVALDEAGRPSFGRLQKRAQLRNPMDAQRTSVEQPVTLFVFDLLGFEGLDLRGLPLRVRKGFLEELLPAAGPLRYTEHFERDGERLFEKVRALGLEGVVGKRAESIYRSGERHVDWVKVRGEETSDFAVVGYSVERGSKTSVGALDLGERVGEGWRYAGKVGTGFTQKERRALFEALSPGAAKAPAAEGTLPKGPGQFWVMPQLVAEVAFKTRTDDGLLRHPVFRRLRTDKGAAECVRHLHEEEAPPPEVELAPIEKQVTLSNLDKVFWPKDGLTKGDLLDYYRGVSPYLLPYLKDRPVVLTRFPDGITGKSFFQKNAPSFLPSWIRVETAWDEDEGKEIRHIVCEDVESLLYLVNLGVIPLHLWASRLAQLQRPDWTIVDLDPKGAPFTDVVTLARELRELCEAIGLPSYAKTSGSTGLHVLIPLGRQATFEEARKLAELLAHVVVSRQPKIATLERVMAARGGRVYLDYLQNGHGKLLVAPFSVRPLDGAPVSMPVPWSAVNKRLTATRFTVKNALGHLKKNGDVLRPVLDDVPDLSAALHRLGEWLSRKA